VLICLAAVAYNWPISGMIILGWWGGALIGFWVKKIGPLNVDRSTFEIMNSSSLGLLSAWLGVWNGFYVWKDLDHDYWRKGCE
jgi:hypothetical protein